MLTTSCIFVFGSRALKPNELHDSIFFIFVIGHGNFLTLRPVPNKQNFTKKSVYLKQLPNQTSYMTRNFSVHSSWPMATFGRAKQKLNQSFLRKAPCPVPNKHNFLKEKRERRERERDRRYSH